MAWRCASLKYAGTVTTACCTFSPKKASAISFILRSTIADTSSGANTFCSVPTVTSTMGLSPCPGTILNGTSLASRCTVTSENLRPMSRFTSNTVLMGLDAAWFLAASPINRWPSVLHPTYEGVIRFPCSLGQISTRPPFQTATQLQGRRKGETEGWTDRRR